MKKLIIAFLLLPFVGMAQYRESGDTIFVNNKMLVPGDTVHLGMGSDPYKNFIFIYLKPTILNISMVNGVAQLNYLKSDNAYQYLIFGGMDFKGKKQKKYGGMPYFYLNGYKNPRNTFYIKLLPAVESKEINF